MNSKNPNSFAETLVSLKNFVATESFDNSVYDDESLTTIGSLVASLEMGDKINWSEKKDFVKETINSLHKKQQLVAKILVLYTLINRFDKHGWDFRLHRENIPKYMEQFGIVENVR